MHSRCAATNVNTQVYLIGRPERGRAAITYTRRLIREGKIVAIKGNRRISSLLRCYK